MADLLECLLQVKGLRTSIGRLEDLAGRAARLGERGAADATAAALAMTVAEARWQAVLTLALQGRVRFDAPPSGNPSDPREASRRFVAARRATLDVLDRWPNDREIHVPEGVAAGARLALRRMLDL